MRTLAISGWHEMLGGCWTQERVRLQKSQKSLVRFREFPGNFWVKAARGPMVIENFVVLRPAPRRSDRRSRLQVEVTVNGRDVNQEELESSDWVTKVSKRVAELQESQQRERDGATRAPSVSSGCGKEGRTMPAGFNGDKHGVSGRPSYKAAGKKLAERSVASHLPRLPNADHTVIIRLKEGLTLTRHSAPVIGGAVRMAAGIPWQKGREEDRIVVNNKQRTLILPHDMLG
ncbi:hypothetical protein HPB51_022250 [Rhipicephalus microplus]|uniref:Uncharacterized protein n=1 Tax=Rhipicephalus microplus TaxID=6941 RepID=A0A9J6DPH3_RHIMP|nr:hypothetical protein HPB51_022250 [Rhipicephalus microplus]